MSHLSLSYFKMFVFDLDNTLAPSKEVVEDEMASLISEILSKRPVAVVSGGSFIQFKKELLDRLPEKTFLLNLHIFPTDGTAYYIYNSDHKDWVQVYQEILSEEQKHKIQSSFKKILDVYPVPEPGLSISYGEIIEDRGSQITFSALGQQAPLEEKKKWDPDGKIRQRMKSILDTALPEFEVTVAGTTSIDITPKGHDKAYAIKKIMEFLPMKIKDILFIGDALFKGGNDFPVIRTGVQTIAVKNPMETKRLIRKLLDNA